MNPVDIIQCRLEIDGKVPFKLFNLNSMHVYCRGLSCYPRGGRLNNTNIYIIINQHASLTLENCVGIMGRIQLKKRIESDGLSYALISKATSYMLQPDDTLLWTGFPQLLYDNYASRYDALSDGAVYKKVLIEQPFNAVDNLLLPMEYPSKQSQSIREILISELLVSGKSVLNTRVYLPMDIVIESIKLYVEAFSTNEINRLDLAFVSLQGHDKQTYAINICNNAAIIGQEVITPSKLLTMPGFTMLYFNWKLDARRVSDSTKFPESRIVIKYRASSSSREANNNKGGEINII